MGSAKNYTEKQVLNAIEGSGGFTTQVARNLKCDWNTADVYIKKYETAKRAIEIEGEKILDVAESKLVKLVSKKEDLAAIKFILNTKGKNRGYVEKQQIEHSGEVRVRKLEDIMDEDN